MSDLEASPFTDWTHPHLLYPHVLAAVQRHFPVSERGQSLLAASLAGGMVAAKDGKANDDIASEFIRPWKAVPDGDAQGNR